MSKIGRAALLGTASLFDWQSNDIVELEYAKADYDYTAASGDELSFKTGDIMRIISKECEDEGWWRGELNGLTGVFPDNFCTVIPLSEVCNLTFELERTAKASPVLVH